MNETNANSLTSRKASITSVSSDTQFTHEVSEEFSLPDYVPEVRKVLYTRAKILPEGKFMSDVGANTSLEFDGTVTYNVIYTDDEGKLCSTPLSSSYEASTVLTGSPSTVFIDTGVENVSCRVTAPRKLTIKTKLRSRALVFAESVIEENITPHSSADEVYIERNTKNVNTVSLKSVSMQNIKMSDKFDMNDKAGLVPVMCDANVTLNDCKAQNGTVSARGEVLVKCLCNDGERDVILTKTLPLYEELEADGALPADMVRCNGRCVSLSISNEQNNDTSQLFFDVNCEIEGEFYRNDENTLTVDCYSTKYETQTAYRNIDTYSVASARNHSFSINDKFKRKDNNIEEIVDVICDAIGEKAENKNGRVMFAGKLMTVVIGRGKANENGEQEYLSESYEIPFKFDVESGSNEAISRVNYDVSVSNARYDNDKFSMSAEVFPSYVILNKGSEQILDSAIMKKDKEYKNNASCVRVFFPKNGDILWEVAKKYHTTRRKIVEDNDLPSYSLDGIKSIII